MSVIYKNRSVQNVTSRDSSSSLRVLHVSACGEAGVADHIIGISRHMSALGVKVTVLGPAGSRLEKAITSMDNVEFVGMRIVKKPSLHHDLNCIYKQHHLMRNRVFDIVHSHSAKAGFLTAISRIGIKNTKFVYCPHCTSANMGVAKLLASTYFAFERWAARRHDFLIATSKKEYNELIQTNTANMANMRIVNNHVDTTYVPTQSGSFRKMMGLGKSDLLIGTAGRLVPQKGVDILVEAFTEIISRIPNTKLAVAGDGPLEAKLHALTHTKKLDASVHFLGHVDDCFAFIDDLDLLVVPSRWESLPLVILRAGVVETPLVVTDVGGVSEVVDESTGWLVAPNDMDALVSAVIEALKNRTEAKNRTARLRKKVLTEYDMAVATRNMLSIYSLVKEQAAS